MMIIGLEHEIMSYGVHGRGAVILDATYHVHILGVISV